jgi:response regulator of citrate/malate metabolism
MVAPLQADLLLPDFSGLDLVRRLAGEPGRVPNFLLVTAARDIDSVRTAMQFGAFYYLVKPFTFVALREQLKAYRAWAERLGSQAEADQNVVDALYSLRGTSPRRAAATRTLQPTMARVLDIVTNAAEPIGATEVAEILGASRPTAQRYLASLVSKQLLDLNLSCGTTGRPEHRYLARRPDAGRPWRSSSA